MKTWTGQDVLTPAAVARTASHRYVVEPLISRRFGAVPGHRGRLQRRVSVATTTPGELA